MDFRKAGWETSNQICVALGIARIFFPNVVLFPCGCYANAMEISAGMLSLAG